METEYEIKSSHSEKSRKTKITSELLQAFFTRRILITKQHADTNSLPKNMKQEG